MKQKDHISITLPSQRTVKAPVRTVRTVARNWISSSESPDSLSGLRPQNEAALLFSLAFEGGRKLKD